MLDAAAHEYSGSSGLLSEPSDGGGNVNIPKRILRLTRGVAEEIFERAVTKQEWADFTGALRGFGKPLEFADANGRRRLEARLRDGVLYIRLGLLPDAVRQSRIEEGKRWRDRMEAALLRLMVRTGRKHLPVTLFLSTIDESGTALTSEGEVAFDERG